MRIVIGSDHFGYPLKEEVRRYLEELGHDPVDVGVSSDDEAVDYPDVAEAPALRIARGEFARGLLVCGTGIGLSMVAN
jgi:ribose 5-phosphate isomerase B